MKTTNYYILAVEDYSSNKGNPDVDQSNYNTLEEATAAYEKLTKEEYKVNGKTCEIQLWEAGADEPLKSEYQVSALVPKGSVIVTYQHVTYMNYAYKVTDVQEVREGERYEDLNVAVDHTYSSWDDIFESVADLQEAFESNYGIFAKLNAGSRIVKQFLADSGVEAYIENDEE